MFLLLGKDGPVRQAFLAELRRRGQAVSILEPAPRCLDVNALYERFRRSKPDLAIYCGGQPAISNGTLAQAEKEAVLYETVLAPQNLTQVCRMWNVPWAKVSPGSIFQGAKVFRDCEWQVEIDLGTPAMRRLLRTRSDRVRGFSESDEPNHCFICPPCDFYSGAVALGEQAMRDVGMGYTWRHGLLVKHRGGDARSPAGISVEGPSSVFRATHRDKMSPSPYAFASITLLEDFVSTCLDLWDARADYGAYHIINPGVAAVSSNGEVRSIGGELLPVRLADGLQGVTCLLDASRLRATGMALRPISGRIAQSREPATVSEQSI